MSESPAALHKQVHTWFDHAQADGWLDETDCARLAAVEQRSPADLFAGQEQRPLVVAFFGGTGVGKSSLLNRLAGQDVARTGIERPTSREMTVYVHNSVALADLPSELPIDTVHIQHHSADAWRGVLWLDAPDIDSTEEANRRCALAWLPHVDLVCYVVSPERYRDDVGWRVLGSRGHRHGWMFVLNRWDEGDASQLEDFGRMLRRAGFEQPLLLPTCCIPGRRLPSDDQFDEIQVSLNSLLRAHGVRELTRLGHRARLQELQAALQSALKRFGSDVAWKKLADALVCNWNAAAGTITEGAEWSLRAIAGRFATRADSVWEQARRQLAEGHGQPRKSDDASPATDITVLDDLTQRLWNDWAQSKLVAGLDAVEVEARRAGPTAAPIRQALDKVSETAGERVTQVLRDSLRAALARAGNVLIRTLRRVTGFLMGFLPLGALLYVAYNVVRAYPAAAAGRAEFFSTPFLVHSGLLVLLAWAVPFFLDRLLRPSLERTIQRALRLGLSNGLEDLGAALGHALAEARASATAHRHRGQELIQELAALLIKPIDVRSPSVGRLLASKTSASSVHST